MDPITSSPIWNLTVVKQFQWIYWSNLGKASVMSADTDIPTPAVCPSYVFSTVISCAGQKLGESAAEPLELLEWGCVTQQTDIRCIWGHLKSSDWQMEKDKAMEHVVSPDLMELRIAGSASSRHDHGEVKCAIWLFAPICESEYDFRYCWFNYFYCECEPWNAKFRLYYYVIITDKLFTCQRRFSFTSDIDLKPL